MKHLYKMCEILKGNLNDIYMNPSHHPPKTLLAASVGSTAGGFASTGAGKARQAEEGPQKCGG